MNTIEKENVFSRWFYLLNVSICVNVSGNILSTIYPLLLKHKESVTGVSVNYHVGPVDEENTP